MYCTSRTSRSEISLTPDPSVRNASTPSSHRSLRQPETSDYYSGKERNRTSSMETATRQNNALSRPSSSDTVYSKPIVHARRRLPTVLEQPSPTIPRITVQDPYDYSKGRLETTF